MVVLISGFPDSALVRFACDLTSRWLRICATQYLFVILPRRPRLGCRKAAEWWNGRHEGLKIPWPLRLCGFESHFGYRSACRLPVHLGSLHAFSLRFQPVTVFKEYVIDSLGYKAFSFV